MKKLKIKDRFRLGIDNIPDWFMTMITENKAILHSKGESYCNGIYNTKKINAEINFGNGKVLNIEHGQEIILYKLVEQ